MMMMVAANDVANAQGTTVAAAIATHATPAAEAAGLTSIEAAVHIGTQEFIKGFVVGQMTLGALVFLLVRVFFFQRSPEVRGDALLHNKKHSDRAKPNASLSSQASEYNILAKTGYDLHRHPDEPCDWLNVFVAQILTRYRTNAVFVDNVTSMLDAAMNSDARPSFMGYIHITDFGLGTEFPHFSNCRVRFTDKTGNLRVEASFSFDDQITLGVDTHLLINWPRTQIAALPISLSVSIVKFSGRIAVEIITDQESSETYAYVSVLQGHNLEFDVRSLLGNRTKVKDLPKLTFLLISRLQAVFAEELVYPCGKKIKIPMLHQFNKSKPTPSKQPTTTTTTPTTTEQNTPAYRPPSPIGPSVVHHRRAPSKAATSQEPMVNGRLLSQDL